MCYVQINRSIVCPNNGDSELTCFSYHHTIGLVYSETWITQGTTKKFELWVMLSLCFSHVATVASLFHSSVFHFLVKLSRICEIFFSRVRKTMKLSSLHKNVITSSHGKGHLMALTAIYQFELWLKVRDMPRKLSLPRQGPWNLVWVKGVMTRSMVDALLELCSHSQREATPHSLQRLRVVFFHKTNIGHSNNYGRNRNKMGSNY